MTSQSATQLTKMLNNLDEVIRYMNNFSELDNSRQEILAIQKDFQNLLNEYLENIQLSKAYLTVIDELIHNKLYLIDNTKKLENNREKFNNLQKELADLSKKHFTELGLITYDTTLRVRKLKEEARIHWFKHCTESDYRIEYFKPIITAFCNWEYPVMELFPGTGKLLQYSLGGEPLYIVDTDEYLLEKCAGQFNEFYANKRLMKYTLDQGYSLEKLPQNSFGFIYNLHYMYAEDEESIYNIASEVLKCLLPGGTYLFSYVPADKWWGVEVMENSAFTGLNTRHLVSTLEKIGFTDIKVTYDTAMTTHVLAKKSGEIEYIKGSSILAKIIDKPTDLL
jgi:SAM-dependent methyltransferase